MTIAQQAKVFAGIAVRSSRCLGAGLKLGAVVLLILFVCSGTASAQIYKYTDANGIVHYSSSKPPGVQGVESFRFPCYASDPSCRGRVNWSTTPLVTAAFAQEISDAAYIYGVDAALIRALIHAESAYKVDAKSPKGAQGLMQLMPGTQQELGVSDPYDAALNIDGGTRYLANLLERFNGDVELATAAYNAGAGAVQRHGGVPPYDETREYVRRIKILHRRYRASGA